MLEKLIHVNSYGEVLDFFSFGILTNANNLRDYEWTVSSSNNRITSFERAITKKQIPIIICCEESRANEIKNAFYEHFEKDVLNQKQGYFIINGYKYFHYVTKSTKTNYIKSKRILYITIEITSDKPFWFKETSYVLPVTSQVAQQSNANEIKKYTYGYPYRYSSLRNAQIIDSGFASSDLIIRFFGYCENPYISIGDEVYKVNCVCDNDEYIEIDTIERTITKVSRSGVKTNMFNYRDKTPNNFFRKLSPGESQVTWDGNYTVEIVVVERRSEPKWN